MMERDKDTDSLMNKNEHVMMNDGSSLTAKQTTSKRKPTSKPKDLCVGVYLFEDGAEMPSKGSSDASCYDLKAFLKNGATIKQIGEDNVAINTVVNKDSFTLYPHARALVPTGIKLDIPKGYDARIYPRSGIPFKDGISVPNSLGVIDSDYKGELFISLINHTNKLYKVSNGDRVAQMEINKLADIELKEAIGEYDDTSTKRSDGGFGSTGK